MVEDYGLELQRGDDGIPEVVWTDGGLVFREAGLGRLSWRPADRAEAPWSALAAREEMALDAGFPRLLRQVRVEFRARLLR